jgi:transposase
VLVTYSEKLARKQRVTFAVALGRLKRSLWDAFHAHRAAGDDGFADVMDRILERSRVGRFLEWEVDSEQVFHVRQRADIVAAHRLEFGVRLLFTTKTDLSSEEIVRLYNHDKQAVEQDFRQLKSPDLVRFSPIRHFTDTKIRLYAMVCILALLVLKVMHRRIQHMGLSVEAMTRELRDIQEVTLVYSPQIAVPTLTDCSSIQEELMRTFDLRGYLPASQDATEALPLH